MAKLQRNSLGKLLRNAAGKIIRGVRCCCGQSPPPPPPPTCFEVTANYLDGNVAYFNGGASFPAGDYEVEYLRGAITYSDGSQAAAQLFRVNSGGSFYYINNGTDVAQAPGFDTTQYATQAEVEAANAGDTTTFTHGGGPIGIRLNDDPYEDNALDTADPDPSPPVFRICPLFCLNCVDHYTPLHFEVTFAGVNICELWDSDVSNCYAISGELNGTYCLDLVLNEGDCYWQTTTDTMSALFGQHPAGTCTFDDPEFPPIEMTGLVITLSRLGSGWQLVAAINPGGGGPTVFSGFFENETDPCEGASREIPNSALGTEVCFNTPVASWGGTGTITEGEC